VIDRQARFAMKPDAPAPVPCRRNRAATGSAYPAGELSKRPPRQFARLGDHRRLETGGLVARHRELLVSACSDDQRPRQY
jgi:hypothetical protein